MRHEGAYGCEMCPRWAYDTYFDPERGLCTTCLEESEKALTPAEAESHGLQFCSGHSVPTSSAYPSGRSDWLCSSVGEDCCACDKSIGQLTCGFDEPATCYDGYVAKIPPGEDYEGSCQYSCYPPDHGGYYYHGLDCSTMTYCEGITETKGEPFYSKLKGSIGFTSEFVQILSKFNAFCY